MPHFIHSRFYQIFNINVLCFYIEVKLKTIYEYITIYYNIKTKLNAYFLYFLYNFVNYSNISLRALILT